MTRTPGHRSPTMPISIMSGSSGALSRPQTDLQSAEAQLTAGRSGGDRTLRHVQWASKDDVGVNVDPAASPRLSMHALDEMGLDPAAFETLRGALERHRSQSVNSGSQLRSMAKPSGNRHRSLSLSQSLPARRSLPSRTTTSPSHAHPNLSADPRAGTSDQSLNPFTVPATVRSSFTFTDTSPTSTTGVSTPFPDSPLLVQRTHDVPGEVWIDPHEREGLPIGPTPLCEGLGGLNPDHGTPILSRDSGGRMSRKG
ncbi:hypothetical protein J3A83DRAFT_2969274 [Scleroderma citrinum]